MTVAYQVEKLQELLRSVGLNATLDGEKLTFTSNILNPPI